jgi:caa(3)-type oxidase subunit IV
MTEKRTPSVTTYIVVCALLIVLTVLTVTISFFDLPGIWHVVIGLCIGAVKGALVVLFFMHALVSSRVTWIVISVACSWLLLMMVLGLTDYFTRGLIPIMTGH